MHNTGGRALDLAGTLVLSDGPGGLSAGPFPATLNATLAVGGSGEFAIALDDRLPAGPWDAVVTLASGDSGRNGKATITFPTSGEAAAVVTGGESERGWRTVASALAVPALGGVVAHQVGRTRSRRRSAPGLLQPGGMAS